MMTMPAAAVQGRRIHVIVASAALVALLVTGLAICVGRAGHPADRGPLAEHLALEDEAGQAFTEQAIRTRPTVLFLGYTSCPDVCPTTLARMARWMRMLGRRSSKLTFAFLSVDPQRDTVAVRRAYVAAFGPGFKGLSGKLDEVQRASRLLDAPYRIELDGNGGYFVAHSPDVIVVGTDGRVAARIKPAVDDRQAVRILQQLSGT